MEPGQVQISELKYRELQIKSRGFDVVRELEVLQTKIGQLQLEKNLVVKSLKELYDYAEANKINQTPPIVNESETTLENKQPSKNEIDIMDNPSTENLDSRKIIDKKITRTRPDKEIK